MLEVRKETTVTIYTSDDKPIHEGDVVAIESAGRVLLGAYAGFVKSGAIKLNVNLEGISIDYNIMPKSIDKIYLVDISAR